VTSPAPRARLTRGAAIAGLGLLTLAGCALDGDDGEAETASPDASSSPTTTTPPSAPDYADGRYTAEGSYVAPSGPETISVSLTLAGDVVTEVSVTGDAVDHSAFEFQRRFAKGIAAEVVGRDIADLSVSRISGSSLTSIGFNAAVEAIRSEALL
jgi:uncharacterized protein with FMN-binding domain